MTPKFAINKTSCFVRPNPEGRKIKKHEAEKQTCAKFHKIWTVQKVYRYQILHSILHGNVQYSHKFCKTVLTFCEYIHNDANKYTMLQIYTKCYDYIHNYIWKWAKRMPDITVETLTSLCSFQYNYTLSEITHVIFLICTLHSWIDNTQLFKLKLKWQEL